MKLKKNRNDLKDLMTLNMPKVATLLFMYLFALSALAEGIPTYTRENLPQEITGDFIIDISGVITDIKDDLSDNSNSNYGSAFGRVTPLSVDGDSIEFDPESPAFFDLPEGQYEIFVSATIGWSDPENRRGGSDTYTLLDKQIVILDTIGATDNLAPFVSYDNPLSLQSLVVGETATISVKATDEDIPGLLNTSLGVERVEFYIGRDAGSLLADNTPADTDTTATTDDIYSFTHPITEPGDYYVLAIAFDAANASTYAYHTFTVAQPNEAATSPATGSQIDWRYYDIVWVDSADHAGKQNLYVHGKQLIILLHGEIITPVVLPAPAGFVYYVNADGSYGEAEPFEYTPAALDSCISDGDCQRVADSELVRGDINSDTRIDTFISAPDGQQASILLSGVQVDDAVEALVQILPSGKTQVPGQPPSVDPRFATNLFASDVTIINGTFAVSGLQFTFDDLRAIDTTTSTVGGSIANDDDITTALNSALPSPQTVSAGSSLLDSLAQVSGEFRVSEMGAATYSVPVSLPQGTAGVTPTISLNYSSQGGDGVMGLGWSLGAGGAIMRCRQTLQVDRAALPITFGASDRFCLNGSRLLVINGTYGAASSQYRTEIDSGVLVTAIGDSSGKLDYFKAEAKDGSVTYYGRKGIDNSEQGGFTSATDTIPSRLDTLSWGLSRFEDSIGNRIEYEYSLTRTHYRITKIKYGYGTGNTPAAIVDLEYGKKDSRPSWVAGYRFEDDSLLKSIIVTDNGENLGEYSFSYNLKKHAADKLNRLDRISHCIDGSCAEPLVMDWGYAKPVAENTALPVKTRLKNIDADVFDFTERDKLTGLHKIHSQMPMDINGDGLQDLLITYSKDNKFTYAYAFQTSNGAFGSLKILWGVSFSGNPGHAAGLETPRLMPVDFNADGRSDLAIYVPTEEKWYSYLSTPYLEGSTSAWKLVATDIMPQVGRTAQFADLNSDGLVDLVYSRGINDAQDHSLLARLLKRNGNLDTSAKAYSYSSDIVLDDSGKIFDTSTFTVGDLNNDGKVEVYALGYDNPDDCAYDINLYAFSLDGREKVGGSQDYVTLFNQLSSTTSRCGDQAGSVSVSGPRGGSYSVYARDHKAQQWISSRFIGPFLVDANNDGLTDIVYTARVDGNGNVHADDPDLYIRNVYYLKGKRDGTFAARAQLFSVPSNSKRARGVQPMDVNFDGRVDFLISRDDDYKRIRRSTGGASYSAESNVTYAKDKRSTAFFDLNGDGAMDKVESLEKDVSIHLGKLKSNNVVTAFTSGFNNTTTIQYEPLRESGRYTTLGGLKVTVPVVTGQGRYCGQYVPTDDSCINYPITTPGSVSSSGFYEFINNPFKDVNNETYIAALSDVPVQELSGSTMPVVTKVSSSSPYHSASGYQPSAKSVVDYFYEGLRVQAGGRGMLGFRSLTTIDAQTGIVTSTEYRQDWPFIGQPRKTVTKTASGQLLKESTSKPGLVLANPPSNGSTAAGSNKPLGPFGSLAASYKPSNPSSLFEGVRNRYTYGTANVGPSVVYTAEAEDITYDVPEAHVRNVSTSTSKTTKQLTRVETLTDVDSWGNVENMTVTTFGKVGTSSTASVKKLQTQVTENTYYGGQGKRLGRLSSSTVTTTRTTDAGEAGTIERKATFTYYGPYSPTSACTEGQHGTKTVYGSTSTVPRLRGLLCSEKTDVLSFSSNDPVYHYSKKPAATEHFYDTFGNKTYTRTGTRVSGYSDYDSKGRYLEASYAVFSQLAPGSTDKPSDYLTPAGTKTFKTSEILARSKHGVPLLSRSYLGNGRSSYATASVTPMGSVYFKGDSSGAYAETSALYGNDAKTYCPASTLYAMVSSQAGGARSGTCHDKVGREVGGFKRLFDGSYSRVEKRYDILGRVIKVSEPSKDAPVYWSDTEYDLLGRPIKMTHPFYVTDANGVEQTSNLATTTMNYDGFATITTSSGVKDKDSRVKRELKNGLGETIKVTEQHGKTGARYISYRYNVLGKLVETTTPKGSNVTINYNSLGQKYSMVDPDKGTWFYEYNQYGDLIWQKDAKKQETDIEYDFAGRKLISTTGGIADTRSGFNKSRDVVLTWEYDTATYGLGKLAKEANTAENFTQQVTYDTLGRVSTTITTLPGESGQIESFYQKQTYDAIGRPFQTFDAARVGPQFGYNGVQNHYNSYGYLSKVTDAKNGGTGKLFYEVQAMDARGNVTKTLYGDGNTVRHGYNDRTALLETITRSGPLGTSEQYKATWDHLGNLVERQDNFSGDIPEAFTYDEHNRLKTYKVATTTVTMDYFLDDNIKSKSDQQSGASDQQSGATYVYDETKAHAVKTIGDRHFKYDPNGNVTEDKLGSKTKSFEYTAKDQVQRITVSGHTTEFRYGTSGRFKRTDTSSSGTTTTLYIGSIEKVYNADNSIQYKRTVGGVAQVIHEVTESTGKLLAPTYKFLHKDHLGSINAITYGDVGSNMGKIAQRMAFDPWGARRQLSSNKLTISALSQSSVLASFAKTQKPITNRGFTGHEMLDEVGIIHMNGRIYDATIGRFLQADPNIDGVKSVGGFNRYAYVKNNPLNATDPTGYFLKKLAKKIFKATGLGDMLRSIAQNQLLSGIISVGLNFIPGCQAWCSAVFNAATTFAVTGSLNATFKGAAIAAVSAAAFNAIGGEAFGNMFSSKAGAHIGRSIAHGMVGGISSVLQGGKFGHGFASAGFTKLMNVNGMFDKLGMGGGQYDGARIAAAALIGGTISQATGGKFANGAVTAALGQAFNGNQQNSREQQAAQKGQADNSQVASNASTPAGNATNALSTDGGMKQCMATCLQDNYGEAYEWAERVSPVSVQGLLTNEAAEALQDRSQKQANRNAWSADKKTFETGRRQLGVVKFFSRFNAAAAVAGAGAAGFQAGALGYCAVDCLSE